MVKALTDRNPTFLQQAYKFDDLELLNELSTVKRVINKLANRYAIKKSFKTTVYIITHKISYGC